MTIPRAPYDSYEAMIADPAWREQLCRLNSRLLEALRTNNEQEVLSGNLFYDHLQPGFRDAELLPDCEQKRRRLFSLAKQASTFFEVGINGGHSMFLALSANPALKCAGVDLCKRLSPGWGPVDIYVEVAMEWLSVAFPGQLVFLKGNSLEEIPAFVQAHPGFQVDLAHIDGDKHTYVQDVKNLWPLLHAGSRIVLDDTETGMCREMMYYLLGAGMAVSDPEYPEFQGQRYRNSVLRVAK